MTEPISTLYTSIVMNYPELFDFLYSTNEKKRDKANCMLLLLKNLYPITGKIKIKKHDENHGLVGVFSSFDKNTIYEIYIPREYLKTYLDSDIEYKTTFNLLTIIAHEYRHIYQSQYNLFKMKSTLSLSSKEYYNSECEIDATVFSYLFIHHWFGINVDYSFIPISKNKYLKYKNTIENDLFEQWNLVWKYKYIDIIFSTRKYAINYLK